MVRIRHNDRFTTEYFHLSRITSGLVKGRAVKQGEVIGAVGLTGLTTGAHLHYGLFDRGKYVNPLTAKLPQAENLRRGLAISKSYLNRVLFTVRHYQEIDFAEYERSPDGNRQHS